MRFFGFLFLFLIFPVQAVTFISPVDNTEWKLDSSKFSCRLTQPVPMFGEAIFEHEAGERVRFTLKPIEKIHFTNGAQLAAEAAPWQPSMQARIIAKVKPSPKTGYLEVAPDYAENMLAALYKGMNPTFTSYSWQGTRESLKVGVSAANFQAAYNDYISCATGLLPVNYRQVARTAILFPSSNWRISDTARKRLDLIALYVKNDEGITGVYVDGHSDNMGRRLMNRDLSRRRAEEVTAYLIHLGVNPEIIITRYHGERYPVVRNDTKANRDRNRRVTVRLERD